MFKKKQARFSVSIPKEFDQNKLWIQRIAWPDQCPCCNEKDGTTLGTYKYQYTESNSQPSTSKLSPATYFSLDWEVPYCLECQKHMKSAENWKAVIVVACIFLPLMLTLALDLSSLTLPLLMVPLFIVGGIVPYKSITKTVVKSSCLDYGLAFRASSRTTDEPIIIFYFASEEYAKTFAVLNSAELETNI